MSAEDEQTPTYMVASYTVRPTSFDDVIHLDKHKWCLTVVDAGDGWAIRRGRMCLNYRNEWEYEPPPGIRDDAFLRRCRFNEHAGLLRSKRVIDRLDFQGETFSEFAARVRTELLDGGPTATNSDAHTEPEPRPAAVDWSQRSRSAAEQGRRGQGQGHDAPH